MYRVSQNLIGDRGRNRFKGDRINDLDLHTLYEVCKCNTEQEWNAEAHHGMNRVPGAPPLDSVDSLAPLNSCNTQNQEHKDEEQS